MSLKHCILCDTIGHTKFYCPDRSTLLKNRTRTKNMTKWGKYTSKWNHTKKRWRKLNPPNHEGYYECYICKVWVLSSDIEVDHIVPRSRAPELRYEMSNLAPCCHSCNFKKGSKVYA